MGRQLSLLHPVDGALPVLPLLNADPDTYSQT